MRIKIYGSRGTISYSNENNSIYGGNSTCVRLDSNGHTVVLDCGSGLRGLAADLRTEQNAAQVKLDILISHLHLDHIIGLSSFEPLWNKESDIRIFAPSYTDSPLDEQVLGVFKPPYWPIPIRDISVADFINVTDALPFELIPGICVTPFPMNHNGGATGFRIDADKTIVYLLDNEIDDKTFPQLVQRCAGADAVIFDASYMPEDYPNKRGWGHSTWQEGVKLAKHSECKLMILAHLSPDYPDSHLSQLEAQLSDNCIIARDSMVIEL